MGPVNLFETALKCWPIFNIHKHPNTPLSTWHLQRISSSGDFKNDETMWNGQVVIMSGTRNHWPGIGPPYPSAARWHCCNHLGGTDSPGCCGIPGGKMYTQTLAVPTFDSIFSQISMIGKWDSISFFGSLSTEKHPLAPFCRSTGQQSSYPQGSAATRPTALVSALLQVWVAELSEALKKYSHERVTNIGGDCCEKWDWNCKPGGFKDVQSSILRCGIDMWNWSFCLQEKQVSVDKAAHQAYRNLIPKMICGAIEFMFTLCNHVYTYI